MSFQRHAGAFHGVLVSNRLDTSGLLIISRYIYGLHSFLLHVWPLLSSRRFLGLPIGRLTAFSLSMDLKEAAKSSAITPLK